MLRTRCRFSKYIPGGRWLAEWWMVGGTTGIVVQWLGTYALNSVYKKNTCVCIYINKRIFVNLLDLVAKLDLPCRCLSLQLFALLMVCEPFLVGSLLPKDGVTCCTEWPRDFAITSSCESLQTYKTDVSDQTVWTNTSLLGEVCRFNSSGSFYVCP